MENPWVLAFCLMLLFEGIIPFLFPKQWREAFSRITQLSDGQIRFIGLLALAAGLSAIGIVNLLS